MASAPGKKQLRAERERTRLYQARRAHHDGRIARRRRDNIVAGVAGGILILAVVGGQIAYYTVGPGTPEPTPSPTATTTPAPTTTDTVTPTPAETPESTPSPTP